MTGTYSWQVLWDSTYYNPHTEPKITPKYSILNLYTWVIAHSSDCNTHRRKFESRLQPLMGFPALYFWCSLMLSLEHRFTVDRYRSTTCRYNSTRLKVFSHGSWYQENSVGRWHDGDECFLFLFTYVVIHFLNCNIRNLIFERNIFNQLN